MTLNLSEVEFEYDFFSSTMPDGSTLVLNKVSEDFVTDSYGEIEVKQINILIEPLVGSDNIICSPVIGTSNDYIEVNTDYEEYLGQVLTEDNMQYCTIEVYEESDER